MSMKYLNKESTNLGFVACLNSRRIEIVFRFRKFRRYTKKHGVKSVNITKVVPTDMPANPG